MKTPPFSHERGNLPGPGEVGPAVVCMLMCAQAFLLTVSSTTLPLHRSAGDPGPKDLGTSALLEQQKWLVDTYLLKDF